MSETSTIGRNTVPDPHPDFAGGNNYDPKGRSQIVLKAKKWLPRNNVAAVLSACLARFAHRLIDRTDGRAYSADELEAKILAQTAGGSEKANLAGGNAFSGTQTITRNGDEALKLIRETAATSTVVTTGSFTADSSGDALDGFGPQLQFRLSDNLATNSSLGGVGYVRAGADNTGDFVVRPQVAGVATERARVTSAGDLILRGSGDAAAGAIGEYFEDGPDALSALATGIAANRAQITLTAGDWDVSGFVVLSFAGATGDGVQAGFSDTSATFDGSSSGFLDSIPFTDMSGAKVNAIPTRRFSLSVETTLFLVVEAGFGVGSVTATAQITARRVR